MLASTLAFYLSSVLCTQMRNCPRLLRDALLIAEYLLQNWTRFVIFLAAEREKRVFSENFSFSLNFLAVFLSGCDVNPFRTLQLLRGNWRELLNQPLITAEEEREPLLLSQQIFRPKFPLECWLSGTFEGLAERRFIAFRYLRFEEKSFVARHPWRATKAHAPMSVLNNFPSHDIKKTQNIPSSGLFLAAENDYSNLGGKFPCFLMYNNKVWAKHIFDR